MKQVTSIVLCLALYISFGSGDLLAKTAEVDPQFSIDVNLALRQVGHQLLLLEGDQRTRIPPVDSSGPNEFTLQLKSSFNYDTLPELLHQAFLSYGIQRPYQVLIKNCEDNTIILGYNNQAFTQSNVSCLGRDRLSNCSNIVLSFHRPVRAISRPVIESQNLALPLFVLSGLAAVGLGFFWKRKQSDEELIPGQGTARKSTLSIGHFSFDPQNQILQLDNQEQSLTFRENKLLCFLANHTNQVVTRETLVAEVWEDEGVIVGRSLDVFISRLRKLLKADETVAIKNIHGVGYRLEVK